MTVTDPTPLTPTRTFCVEFRIANTSLAFTALMNTCGTSFTGLPLMISISVVRPSKVPVAASNVPMLMLWSGAGTGSALSVFLMSVYACSNGIVSARASGE